MNVIDGIYAADSNGNISVWDLKSGTTLMQYKSGAISPRCLNVLNNDYILAAEKGPLLYAWPINSQERLQNIRMLCHGLIERVSLSPDNCYVAVSIENKLNIWQISTGKLLNTVTVHYQPITVVKWSPDSDTIVTGGEDGIICVWKLSSLISDNRAYAGFTSDSASSQCEPRFTISDHAVRITDIHIGIGGLRCRMFTASSDKTCKIYDLTTGTQLLSIAFDARPTSVIVDPAEHTVFVGSADGSIRLFGLLSAPRDRETHERPDALRYVGHEKAVNCLAMSINGLRLVSGSMDETVRVWDVASGQCLRRIAMKGPLTNLLVKPWTERRGNTVLRSFEKRYDQKEETMEIFCGVDMTEEEQLVEEGEDSQLKKLQATNRELYGFIVDSILQNEKAGATKKTSISKKSRKNKKSRGNKIVSTNGEVSKVSKKIKHIVKNKKKSKKL